MGQVGCVSSASRPLPGGQLYQCLPTQFLHNQADDLTSQERRLSVLAGPARPFQHSSIGVLAPLHHLFATESAASTSCLTNKNLRHHLSAVTEDKGSPHAPATSAGKQVGCETRDRTRDDPLYKAPTDTLPPPKPSPSNVSRVLSHPGARSFALITTSHEFVPLPFFKIDVPPCLRNS